MDYNIYHSLQMLKPFREAEQYFFYFSQGYEVDTRVIAAELMEEGKTVCFPVCLPDHEMAFIAVKSFKELKKNAYGIPAPVYDPAKVVVPNEKTICIVPALAVDVNGNRLGYGGGYYDRWLAKHKVTTVALCYQINFVRPVPAGERDVRMDYVITDKRMIATKPENRYREGGYMYG